MQIELFKYITPFAIFLFGLICIPLVEYLKDSRNKRILFKNFKVELSDEIEYFKSSIKKSSNVLMNLNSINIGSEPEYKEIRFVARSTSLIFLNDTLNKSYYSSTKSQRKQLKVFEIQLSTINENMRIIKSLNVCEKNIIELIKQYQAYIYTSCCLRYCMQSFIDGKVRLTGDESIIKEQLIDLNLDVQFNDLARNVAENFGVKNS